MVAGVLVALVLIVVAALIFPPHWIRNIFFVLICVTIIAGIAVILGRIFSGWGAWVSFAFTPFAMHWAGVLLNRLGVVTSFYKKASSRASRQQNTANERASGKDNNQHNNARGYQGRHHRYDRQNSHAYNADMDKDEAMAVLGLTERDLPLTEGSIQAAYRRLIVGVHPDQGGSTYLTAKINQARSVLMRLCVQ